MKTKPLSRPGWKLQSAAFSVWWEMWVLHPKSVYDQNRRRAGCSNLRRGIILSLRSWEHLETPANTKWDFRVEKNKNKDSEGGNLPALWFCLIAPSGGHRCSAPHWDLLLVDWSVPERRGTRLKCAKTKLQVNIYFALRCRVHQYRGHDECIPWGCG